MRRVTFNDSSDDDNNHVAAVEYISDGAGDSTTRTGSDEERNPPGWLSRIAARAMEAVTSKVVGRGDGVDREPFAVRQESNVPPPASWGQYNIFRAPDENADAETETRSGSFEESETELSPIGLRDVILQYQRTPDPFWLNIILAALKAGNGLLNGDVFDAAAGNGGLIKTLLESGHVNVNDPEVQRIVQTELDNAIVPCEQFDGRINPENADYINVLCSIKSTTLTRENAFLFHHSGFEYVKILYTSPHLVRNIPPRPWSVELFLNICNVVDIIVRFLGFIAALIHFACVVWIAHYWYTSPRYNFGYWTILCYVGGYVASLVTTVVSERGKIRDYADRIWGYPASNLKVVPGIPLFEMVVAYVCLRYDFCRDKSRFFVIHHDLRNAQSTMVIIHSMFHAFPQLLVQYFLFEWGQFKEADVGFGGFWLLVGTSFAVYGMSIYLFIRRITTQYSCNSYGFAIFATDVRKLSMMPNDLATRSLILMLAYVLECNGIFIFISVLNTTGCSASMLVLIGVTTGVTALTIIGCIITLSVEIRYTRIVGLFSVPPLLMQIAYSAYVVSKANDDHSIVCTLYALTCSVHSRVNYMTFGFLCVSFLVWVAVLIYERITGRLIDQRWLDHYFS